MTHYKLKSANLGMHTELAHRALRQIVLKSRDQHGPDPRCYKRAYLLCDAHATGDLERRAADFVEVVARGHIAKGALGDECVRAPARPALLDST